LGIERQIIDFANQKKLPSMFVGKEWLEEGGLMCYGVRLPEWYRLAASYVDKVLIVLRHKLQRVRSFELRRERCFDFAPQHGQRDRMAASLTVRQRRMVAIEFGT